MKSAMRLGCFVIHGDDVDLLGKCLDDLIAVGDEVVAISSTSSEMANLPALDRRVRSIHHEWEGYGAARAAAAAALKGCDYLFFLDSDEVLAEGSRERLIAWKTSSPTKRYYRVKLRDWVELPERRFLFRTEMRKRIVRADAALWAPEMVVHESLPNSPDIGVVDATVDHRFVTSISLRAEKNERYALLWAVQAFCEGKRPRPRPLQRPGHWFRNAAIKGSVLRGGMDAAKLSWMVAHYHARKYELLRDVANGAHADLVDCFRSGDYAKFLRLATVPLK